MKPVKYVKKGCKILLPVILGGAILWWMYRGINVAELKEALGHKMNWTWMWLSFPFGVLAQLFRAWRWRQLLAPLGDRPRRHVCVNAIFLSYASSLVVPRVGEVLRCGLLRRYEGVAFSRSVGTVVTERVVDMLTVLLVAGGVLLMQFGAFGSFFEQTGMSLTGLFHRFTPVQYGVAAALLLLACLLGGWGLRKLSVFSRFREMFRGLYEGLFSLRKVRNMPLFLFYSFGIWVAYFLHLYLTFFCFDSTAGLGLPAAAVAFIVGCFAVLVPTPNGAGPWHFAVKTVLVMYGVSQLDAALFVLIVHSLQTLLVVVLGLYALVMLQFAEPRGEVPDTTGEEREKKNNC